MMKLVTFLFVFFGATEAFHAAAPPAFTRTSSLRMAEIGDTGIAFENVAREWRCKYSPGPSGGPGDSESLKACQALLSEFLPKIKALPGAKVTRQVCGGCLDFKVSIVQVRTGHVLFFLHCQLTTNVDKMES